jgi:hypothetical protein
MEPETNNPAEETESKWDATWEGTRRAQLKTDLSATPEQRLAWLEEAMRLAYASGALPLQAGGQKETRPSECTERVIT